MICEEHCMFMSSTIAIRVNNSMIDLAALTFSWVVAVHEGMRSKPPGKIEVTIKRLGVVVGTLKTDTAKK